MRTFVCTCHNTLFYDNSLCLTCQNEVGFCPHCRNVVALLPAAEGTYTCGRESCGAALRKCLNYSEHQVCNRCVAAESEPGALCDCCRFNDTIPDLSVAGNLTKWYRLETAKRRLFYDLSQLALPYGTTCDGIDPPLTFDFKADVIPKADFWRSMKAERVYTGHAAGRITINVREADDVHREKLRVDMGESQRTLIGHFRHEVGHYYWDLLIKGRREAEFVAVFGDHNSPTYAEALERHYTEGPPADWQTRHISAYASMHPWEDFAETWATYLDMVSALDTADHMGFGGQSDPVNAKIEAMIARYQQLGVALNEFNRSLGLLDLVPEVFVPAVVEKLRFIHELVLAGRAENGILQPVDPVESPSISAAPVETLAELEPVA
jgi:hypothetical protein